MCAESEMIADLDRIRPAEALLLDDSGNSLARGQQECSDGRRDGRSNLCDPLVADDARPARHLRDKTQRRCPALDGQSRFVDTADAADFYSGSARRSNEISPVFSPVHPCGLCGEKVFTTEDTGVHRGLLAVRNPDVLYLGGMLKKPASLSEFGVEPVDGATFVCPDLLQIAHRHRLGRSGAGFIAKAPDGIDIVVLSERLQKLRRVPGHNIQRTTRQITGVEKLVEIARDKRIGFRRNGDYRVSHRKSGHYNGKKTEQRRLPWTDDANRTNGFVHRDCDISKRGIVHGAIKLIGPSRVREKALDTEIHFRSGLLFADHSCQAMRDFIAPLGKILRAVVKNLGPIMRGGFRPRCSFSRSLYCVPDVFAIA